MLENTSVGFVPEGNGRGTIAIIWSCLSTWFVCLWVIFHINIPAPSDPRTVRTLRQACFMILGALAPEFIVSIAYTQRREVQRLFFDYQELSRASNFPIPCISNRPQNRGRVAAERLRRVPFDDWTLEHSFYCLMDGFIINPPNSERSFPVNGGQLLWWSKQYNVSTGTPLKIISWQPGAHEELLELSLKAGISIYRKRSLLEFPRMLNFIVLEEDWQIRWWNSPNWIALISTGLISSGVHCIAWDFQ